MIEQTKQLLTTLKCNGMLSTIDARLAEATTGGWGHTEFLSALITDEKLHRDNQKTARRLKSAHFRTDASLERIDCSIKRNLSRTQVQDLMELRFVREPRNIIILGATGVGKTFLATAIGQHACRKDYSCFFIGVSHLIDRLALARADGSFFNFREKLIKTDLLILDDLGLKLLPPAAIQDLHDVLEERFHNKSTIITSQFPIENWKEVIPDLAALEAILDRLVHGAIMLTMAGESYRKKLRKQKELTQSVNIA